MEFKSTLKTGDRRTSIKPGMEFHSLGQWMKKDNCFGERSKKYNGYEMKDLDAV